MMASTKLSLKLLIDSKSEKVLFAEASKEVVDFLFNLLQLPLGSVVKLLTKKGVVGCLGNLYDSVQNLDDTYLQTEQVKDALLNPKISASSTVISGLLPHSTDAQSTIPYKLYMCASRCSTTVTEVYNSPCDYCKRNYNPGRYTAEVEIIRKDGETGSSFTKSYSTGFVKGVVTYMVMDNLVIQPMSTISSITLLNQFNVKDVGVLKEKVVSFGMDEGIKLLKASLQSEMVLTSVFMKIIGS